MHYLTQPEEIREIIAQLACEKVLWLDTEVADWQTDNPRLSLIQATANPIDRTGEAAYVLDVLDRPDLVADFVDQIMANPNIEKVFHNAPFDIRYLGGKETVQHCTCTFKMVRKLCKKKRTNPLVVTNKKLKTLATELCHFTDVSAAEQASDWGQRPLTPEQLHYAKMDVVYLSHVHQHLLNFKHQSLPSSVKAFFNTSDMPTNSSSFSVTNLKLAFECPRLFYLHQHFGGKTLFLPQDSPRGIGKGLHSLAEEFIQLTKQNEKFQAIFKLPAQQLKKEEVAPQMQQLFYELKFFNYLQEVIQTNPTQVTAVQSIWQGLTLLIQRWAELLIQNRKYCQPTNLFKQTFIAEEAHLDDTFILPNGIQQRIVGKLDSLVFDFEKHCFCVVDYKTYEPIDPSAQLAQVALYSYLVWKQKQVPVDSAVYCVLPEFKEYYYSWEQLEQTVHQLTPHKLQQMLEWLDWQPPQSNPPPPTTQPHLCQICPQQEKCQSYFGESTIVEKIETPVVIPVVPQPTKPKPIQTFTNEEANQEADQLGQALVTTFQSYNVDVDYLGAIVAPAFIRVKLKPHLGVKVVSLLNRSDDLQVQLGIEKPPLIAPQPGFVSVDIPRKDRQIAWFDHYIGSAKHAVSSAAPVSIAIGINLEGKLVEADLSNPNTCHFLVGGTTGSGKSEFLRSLLLSLLYRHPPESLKIALVDPKRVTFPEFETMPWLLSPIVKESETAIELMEELVIEMEQRYQRFEAAGCSSIDSYNQKKTSPMPRLVCIFDEYADFMADKETRTILEQSIQRLGAMSRAAGIHLIISTQRPDAKVVTPLIRSNLPGRIALRTASEADSKIILGGSQIEAAYLLGKGDLLYQVSSSLERLQSLYTEKIELPSNL